MAAAGTVQSGSWPAGQPTLARGRSDPVSGSMSSMTTLANPSARTTPAHTASRTSSIESWQASLDETASSSSSAARWRAASWARWPWSSAHAAEAPTATR